MNLIPLIRRNLFVDLEYNIYNKELGLIRNVNDIIEDNLIDLNKVGISSMSKISLNKFVRKYIHMIAINKKTSLDWCFIITLTLKVQSSEIKDKSSNQLKIID